MMYYVMMYGPGPFPAIQPEFHYPPVPPPPHMYLGTMENPANTIPNPMVQSANVNRPYGPAMGPGPMMMPPSLMTQHHMCCPLFQGHPLDGVHFPPVSGPHYRNKSHRRNIMRRNKKRIQKLMGTNGTISSSTPEKNFLNDMTRPWITDEIRAENVKKKQMHMTARLEKTDEVWSRFRDQRESCNRIVREARQLYINTHPEELKNERFQINPQIRANNFAEDIII